jgi:hypothetical protein
LKYPKNRLYLSEAPSCIRSDAALGPALFAVHGFCGARQAGCRDTGCRQAARGLLDLNPQKLQSNHFFSRPDRSMSLPGLGACSLDGVPGRRLAGGAAVFRSVQCVKDSKQQCIIDSKPQSINVSKQQCSKVSKQQCPDFSQSFKLPANGSFNAHSRRHLKPRLQTAKKP